LDEVSESYIELNEVSLVIVEGSERFILRQMEEGKLDAALVIAEEGPHPRLVAKDALVIIVHPSNPVDSLSLTELKSIYAGYTLDWEPLGGEGEIVLVSREEGSAARAFFEERIMQGERVSPTAVVMPSSRDVVGYVSLHPGAVGYVSMGSITEGVKAVRLEGYEPSPATVAAGKYPLVFPAYAVAYSEAGWSLVEFLTGPVGRSLIGNRYALP